MFVSYGTSMIVKHVAPGPQQQRDVYSGPDVENKNNRRARLAIEKVKITIILTKLHSFHPILKNIVH